MSGGLVYQTYSGGNRLLDRLPEPERDALLPSLQVVGVEVGHRATNVNERFAQLIFPIDAIFSVCAEFGDGSTAEVGTVGREAFLPCEALGSAPAAYRSATCQVAGRVATLPCNALDTAWESGRELGMLLLRNTTARLFAAEQLTACNLAHSVVERCARWLLATRDRTGRDEFALTHESLSLMIGVRRPTVSEAAGLLQRQGTIRYSRGRMTIVDPAKLLRSSCDCYGMTNVAFDGALDSNGIVTKRTVPPERSAAPAGSTGSV